ncbi:MAG: carbohydrate ABC transporter permease, partial [Dehalococcoidia bacterium]
MSTLAISRGVQLPAPERVAQWVVRRGPLHIVLLGIGFIWLLPTLGLLVSSFRDQSAVNFSGWWTAFDTPLDFTIQNYQDVIGAQGMGQGFRNSLYITVPATFLTVAVASFAAYAFAWMKFPFRDTIFLIIVALMVVPIQMTLIPVLKFFSLINFTGEYWAMWLAHAAYGLPFAVFLLRNFFAA